MIFLQLFLTFFMIGTFTIGGGYAMLPLIEHQVVTVHEWITESMFTDIVAISQMTPGPIGINSATYIGYSVIQASGAGEFLSILGSMTATFAVSLPSFLIVLAIVKAYERVRRSATFKGVMECLRPVVVGLIGAAAIILITPDNFPDWKSWAIFAAAFAAAMWTRLSPVLLILIAGAVGFVLY